MLERARRKAPELEFVQGDLLDLPFEAGSFDAATVGFGVRNVADLPLALAELLERTHPELVVSNMKKELRRGKVLVDWSQNNQHKTTVCVYSLRAKERPTASTPVTWDEVEKCLNKGDPELLAFESSEVLKRVDKHGDLFEPVLELEQEVPKL